MDKINWTWLHQEMGGNNSGETSDLLQIALPFGMSLAFAIAHRIAVSGKKRSSTISDHSGATKSPGGEEKSANSEVVTSAAVAAPPSTPSTQAIDASNPNATLSQEQLVLALAERVRQLEEQLVNERVAHTTQAHNLEQQIFYLQAQNNQLSQDLSDVQQQKRQLEEQLTLTRLSKVQEVTELHSQLYLQSLPTSPMAAAGGASRHKSPSSTRRSKSPTWKRTSHSSSNSIDMHVYSS